MKKPTTRAKTPRSAVPPAPKPRKPKAAPLAAPIPEPQALPAAALAIAPATAFAVARLADAPVERSAAPPAPVARADEADSPARARPAAARRARALHHGPVSDVALAGLRRLGVASARVAGQAAAARAKGHSQGRAFRELCRLRPDQPRQRTLHRAAAAGFAVQGRGVEKAAVLLLSAMVSAQPAMVAQRHDGDWRRLAASRADRELSGAAGARHGFAGQFHRHQSGGAQGHARGRRHEPRAWRDEFLGRLGTGSRGQAADRRRKIPSRRDGRRDAGRRRLSQPPDRTDPVQADDGAGPGRSRCCSFRPGS